MLLKRVIAESHFPGVILVVRYSDSDARGSKAKSSDRRLSMTRPPRCKFQMLLVGTISESQFLPHEDSSSPWDLSQESHARHRVRNNTIDQPTRRNEGLGCEGLGCESGQPSAPCVSCPRSSILLEPLVVEASFCLSFLLTMMRGPFVGFPSPFFVLSFLGSQYPVSILLVVACWRTVALQRQEPVVCRCFSHTWAHNLSVGWDFNIMTKRLLSLNSTTSGLPYVTVCPSFVIVLTLPLERVVTNHKRVCDFPQNRQWTMISSGSRPFEPLTRCTRAQFLLVSTMIGTSAS